MASAYDERLDAAFAATERGDVWLGGTVTERGLRVFGTGGIVTPAALEFGFGAVDPSVITGGITLTPSPIGFRSLSLLTKVTAFSLDVRVVWAYAKRGNIEDFDLVMGTEDPSKTPAFKDYEVQVYSKVSVGGVYVLRRTALVTVEEYTYTAAMNISDAGGFQPYVKLVVTTRDTTSYRSVSREIEVFVARSL